MRNLLLIVLILILSALFGCDIMEKPIEISLPQRSKPVAAPPQSTENRFTEPEASAAGAVENALMWSKKYDEVSIRAEKLTEKNSKLIEENTNLKHQLSLLEVELEQTKKELDEANTFLQEMHLELTRWKSDVIGFRDEIRKSQSAQLEALTHILKILGAEMAEPLE
jgi:chromosome segregation ATPase